MARFVDERAGDEGAENWDRIVELVAGRKTVEVYRRTEEGNEVLFLRVWTGKRKDKSNRVDADPALEY